MFITTSYSCSHNSSFFSCWQPVWGTYADMMFILPSLLTSLTIITLSEVLYISMMLLCNSFLMTTSPPFILLVSPKLHRLYPPLISLPYPLSSFQSEYILHLSLSHTLYPLSSQNISSTYLSSISSILFPVVVQLFIYTRINLTILSGLLRLLILDSFWPFSTTLGQ